MKSNPRSQFLMLLENRLPHAEQEALRSKIISSEKLTRQFEEFKSALAEAQAIGRETYAPDNDLLCDIMEEVRNEAQVKLKGPIASKVALRLFTRAKSAVIAISFCALIVVVRALINFGYQLDAQIDLQDALSSGADRSVYYSSSHLIEATRSLTFFLAGTLGAIGMLVATLVAISYIVRRKIGWVVALLAVIAALFLGQSSVRSFIKYATSRIHEQITQYG